MSTTNGKCAYCGHWLYPNTPHLCPVKRPGLLDYLALPLVVVGYIIFHRNYRDGTH